MKTFLFILFASLSAAAHHLNPLDDSARTKTLRQQGQLVTVVLTVGDPIRFFVVGREEAQFDLNALKLTVRRLNPYPGKILTVNKEEGYYVIPDASAKTLKPYELEVTTTLNNKVETHLFKIEPLK